MHGLVNVMYRITGHIMIIAAHFNFIKKSRNSFFANILRSKELKVLNFLAFKISQGVTDGSVSEFSSVFCVAALDGPSPHLECIDIWWA